MSMPSMQGLWTFPSKECPEADNFMYIDEVRGRIVLFSTMLVGGTIRRAPSMMWFRRETVASIATRLWRNKEWRIHTFEIQNDHIIWSVAGEGQPWRRVSRESYPGWLDSSLAKTYAKMDEEEAEERARSSG